jgi:hypothetical protein
MTVAAGPTGVAMAWEQRFGALAEPDGDDKGDGDAAAEAR